MCIHRDTDGKVPILSTRYSLKELKLNVTKEWKACFEEVEVGGRGVKFQNRHGTKMWCLELGFLTMMGFCLLYTSPSPRD